MTENVNNQKKVKKYKWILLLCNLVIIIFCLEGYKTFSEYILSNFALWGLLSVAINITILISAQYIFMNKLKLWGDLDKKEKSKVYIVIPTTIIPFFIIYVLASFFIMGFKIPFSF